MSRGTIDGIGGIAVSKPRKIYGFGNIQRMLQKRGSSWLKKENHSISDKPHANSREVARRLRQAKSK